MFWVESSKILCKLTQIFFFPSLKIKQFQFCDICGYKKGKKTNFFSSFSFVAVFRSGIKDPRSGMEKKSGFGIRNNHTGSATLVVEAAGTFRRKDGFGDYCLLLSVSILFGLCNLPIKGPYPRLVSPIFQAGRLSKHFSTGHFSAKLAGIPESSTSLRQL